MSCAELAERFRDGALGLDMGESSAGLVGGVAMTQGRESMSAAKDDSRGETG
jgi:hypothetical protein